MKTDTKDSAIFSELLSPYCSEEEKEQLTERLKKGKTKKAQDSDWD